MFESAEFKTGVTRPKKVTVFQAILEVNSIIGEVWDFMAQFETNIGKITKIWNIVEKYCLKVTLLVHFCLYN